MDDDDVFYYIGEILKLEGETENKAFVGKSGRVMTAQVLMATPCTKSLGCESGGAQAWRRNDEFYSK